MRACDALQPKQRIDGQGRGDGGVTDITTSSSLNCVVVHTVQLHERCLTAERSNTGHIHIQIVSVESIMLVFGVAMRVAVISALVMATAVSSSFAPRSSFVRISKIDHAKTFLAVKGGSEEANDIEQAPIPQVPVPEPIQPATAAQIVPDASLVAPPAATEVKQTANLGPNAPLPGLLRRTFPSFPWYQLPNYLTYVRALAIPALIYTFYQPNMHIVAGILFAIASFTDWLDGYLARRWDITSPFGAFLDPVADKLMVSTSLILLAGRYGARVAVPAAIILAREIAVSALREWMAQRGERDAVKVGFQGKVKTALTMVALTVLLFVPYPDVEEAFLSKLFAPGLVMLYGCSIVTVTSGSLYFIAAAPLLKAQSK